MGKKKKTNRKVETTTFRLSPFWAYGLLLVIICFFGLIRARLLNFPLERDEGEYAYAGQLILHAVAPYQLCYSMKLPGTAAAYALILALFGESPTGVHLGLLIVNSATIVLVYFLAQQLFGKVAGIVAAASYALLSLEPSVLGFAGHATQFVVLPAMGGILMLLKALRSNRLPLFFASGMLLGLAFLMKQPGIFFVLFGLVYLLQRQWKHIVDRRRLILQVVAFLLGAVFPFGLTCLLLLGAGVFQKFWFWTFLYASEYGTIVRFSEGLRILWDNGLSVIGPASFLWIIAAAGLITLFWDRRARVHAVFVTSFLVFSFAAVCPGLYFRQHYFVLLLPATSLLCGIAVGRATDALAESRASRMWVPAPALTFLIALMAAIIGQAEFFFEADPVLACRAIYAGNPFTEALKIADFLKAHSTQDEKIAVIGSEPEIYFYSGRQSATGYIYMYPLMEPQPFAITMQKEMISEIEQARPELVVLVDSPLSWLRKPDSDTTILEWTEKVVRRQYRLVGIADMFEEKTEYHWDDAATYRPRSPLRIFVFKKTA